MAKGTAPSKVNAKHYQQLKDAGISDDVIRARGYESLEHESDNFRRMTLYGFTCSRNRLPGLLIPLHNLVGETWGYQLRTDNPVHDTNGKLQRYLTPKGQKAQLDISRWDPDDNLINTGKPIIVSEGAKKIDAVASLGYCAVGLMGVTMWHVPQWEHLKLSGREMYIAFDSDYATNRRVNTQLQKLARHLGDLGAQVFVCNIPAGADGSKVGLDDYLGADGDMQTLLNGATERVRVIPVDVPDDRPQLDVTNEADLFDTLHNRLGAGLLTDLFLRGSKLVRVLCVGEDGYIEPENKEDENGPAQVQPVSPNKLKGIVQTSYWTFRWVKGDNGVRQAQHYPPAMGACISVVEMAEDSPNLLPLNGVIHTPVVLPTPRPPHGALLDEPGYHRDTGLLYLPGDLKLEAIPKEPTNKDVVLAYRRLSYMITDYRFVTPSDRCNYFGYLLTPLLRLVVPPPYPLYCFNAHESGSGKGYLARIGRILYGGVFRSKPPGEEDEIRKSISVILMTSTGAIVQWDNVTKVISSGEIAALLTESTWQERKLGRTENTPVLPNDRVWCVTGNNIALGGDIPGRAVWVSSDPGVLRPRERKPEEFWEANLMGYVRQYRGEIMSDLLMLVRYWAQARNRPLPSIRSDDYSRYASVVGGILQHAGVPGRFWSPETDKAPEAEEREDWAVFLAEAHACAGDAVFTVHELLNMSGGHWGDALPGDLGGKYDHNGANSVATSLGRWFKNHEGRAAGGYVARSAGKDRHNRRQWCVQKSR